MKLAHEHLAILGVVGAVSALTALAVGCGSDNKPDQGTAGDAGAANDGDPIQTFGGDGSTLGDGGPCDNLQCNQVTCQGGAKTTLSGTVYDPAGKVPVYNAIVYVPNRTPKPITLGASCEPCSATAFAPLTIAITDAAGHFTLENVPVMDAMPLVVQVGKWRRQLVLPKVTACQDNPISGTDIRLPRNQSEGDIPRIAITTGGADPLECLLRKVGVDDSEFDVAGGNGRIHLYAGYGYTPAGGSPSTGASQFSAQLHNGAAFPDAQAFWSDSAKLASYDILLMACEGQRNEATKPLAARQALYKFEQAGGRVFASHWHDYWFNQEAPTQPLATWDDTVPPPVDPTASTIDDSFPKGAAFKQFLQNTSSLDANGKISIKEPKHNVDAVTPDAGAQQWITLQNANAGGKTAVEYMTFNTPIGVDPSAQCGRVVYSDLHVSSGDTIGQPFPSGCHTTDLSPQEKALEFMLFDLSSCVQPDSQPPSVPR